MKYSALHTYIVKVVRIELYTIDKICPLVYKCSEFNKYYDIGKYSIQNDTNFKVHSDNKVRTVELRDIYFKNGYSEYISLEKYAKQKYNITV